MSLEESTDISHEYCLLQPEQQLPTSDMTVHPSSQDFEGNDKDIMQPVQIFKRTVCKNCSNFNVIKQNYVSSSKFQFQKILV
jgi:hypothetical protein